MARYVVRTCSLAWVNPRKGLPYFGWRQTEHLVVGRYGQFLCRCVILHFKPWIKVVECIREWCVIITGLWRGLVVCDGLNGLPQAPCVSAVCEVIVDFFLSIWPFCIFDATGLIWMLHLWSLAAHEPLLSSKSNHLYLYSTLYNTECVKAALQFQTGEMCAENARGQ